MFILLIFWYGLLLRLLLKVTLIRSVMVHSLSEHMANGMGDIHDLNNQHNMQFASSTKTLIKGDLISLQRMSQVIE